MTRPASAPSREDLKRKSSLVRGVVLHSGKVRPLEDGILALPWGWIGPGVIEKNLLD